MWVLRARMSKMPRRAVPSSRASHLLVEIKPTLPQLSPNASIPSFPAQRAQLGIAHALRASGAWPVIIATFIRLPLYRVVSYHRRFPAAAPICAGVTGVASASAASQNSGHICPISVLAGSRVITFLAADGHINSVATVC